MPREQSSLGRSETSAEAELRACLREVYDYMSEVESRLAGQAAVHSYLSLPRTVEERKAIGERARRLLGIEDSHA